MYFPNAYVLKIKRLSVKASCSSHSFVVMSGLSHSFLGMRPGKISGFLTKIGKFDIVRMYDVSIARLIPIIKLTFFLDI